MTAFALGISLTASFHTQPIATPETPIARSGHTMVWHDADAHAVLYGGLGPDGNRLDDTWAWSPENGWTRPTDPDAESPPPLQDHVMAYDAGRERVVLFGGLSGFGGRSGPATVEIVLE